MATAAKFDADFSKFIGEFDKVEVKLRAFKVSADTAGSAASKLADSLNGNKIAEQAAVAVKAIQSIDGGVSALTKGELRRMGAVIDEATEKFHKMGRQVPADMAAVKSALDSARTATESISAPASKLTDFFSQGLGLGAGLSVIGAAQTVLGGITEQLGLMWTEGQKVSQIGTAFESLAGGAGPAAGKLANVRDETRGLVTDLELMQAANKAALLGLDKMGIQFDDMAGIAVKLGKAMGQDAAKSVDDLTTALARQSPMILDNLGISVKVSEANEKYAASIGKTVSALTEEETKLAFGTAAMEAAREKAATLGEQSLTLGEEITRLGNVLVNTRNELGAAANESGLAATALGLYTDKVEETIGGLGEAWESFQSINSMMGEVIGTTGSLTDSTKTFSDGLTLFLVPGLGAANLAVKAYKDTLEAMDAILLRQRGKLDVDVLPTPEAGPAFAFSKPQGDRQSSGFGRGTADVAMGEASKKWLGDYVKGEQADYEKANEARLKALEKGETKVGKTLENARKATAARLEKLSGGDVVAKALVDAADVKALKGKLSGDAAAKVFAELLNARAIAEEIRPQAVKGIQAALDSLASNPGVVAAARAQGAKLLKVFGNSLAGADAADFGGAIKVTQSQMAGIAGVMGKALGGAGADTYALKKGLDGIGIPMGVINETFDDFIGKTGKWTDGIESAANAFATLAQITEGMGGNLDAITGGIGAVLGAANAGGEFGKSINQAFGGKADMSGKLGKVAGVAGVGLAGFSGGASLAAAFGTQSKTKGALAGAAGGAAAGAMAGSVVPGIGTAVGAGVGAIAGAIGGMLQANKAAKEARALMDTNRKELLAFYGSRENLITQSKRLGISEAEVNKNILNNEKDAKAYAATMDKLTKASEREVKAAQMLSTNLGNVAKMQGVASKETAGQLKAALAAGEGAPQLEVAKSFMDSQRSQLLAGLQGALESGPLSPALVQSIGNTLPLAFEELRKSGLTTNEAMRTLEPTLAAFQKNAVLAGKGSTQGFDELNTTLGVLNDAKLGPLVDQAGFASQSLAALQNMGFLTQSTFDGFAGSVTSAYSAIADSKGADQALRTLQQPLQNVWQLQQDFGYVVDEGTAALLAQAEAAGTVGDKMRPAADRMATSLDSVVEKLDEMLRVFRGDLVDGAEQGANDAGSAIENAFNNVHPVVRVRYDLPPLPAGATTGTTSGDAGGGGTATTAPYVVQQSSEPGNVYLDGREVGQVILPHLSDVLETNGV